MSILTGKRFTIIGAGNIGRILIERLQFAGVSTGHLTVCDPSPERVLAVTNQFGVRFASLTDEAIADSDGILITTPPPIVSQVLQTLAGQLKSGQVVVSFAAAVPVAALEAMVPEGISVARIMPNAPSCLGLGMNPVTYGHAITPVAHRLVEGVLAALGQTIEVDDAQMNGCVGLSGAAMRSLLPVLEGMTRSGLETGLSAGEARRVAAQVMLGTASLALQTDLSFDQIKAMTPMETVDEVAVAQLFYEAAQEAKQKVDGLQNKLFGEEK